MATIEAWHRLSGSRRGICATCHAPLLMRHQSATWVHLTHPDPYHAPIRRRYDEAMKNNLKPAAMSKVHPDGPLATPPIHAKRPVAKAAPSQPKLPSAENRGAPATPSKKM